MKRVARRTLVIGAIAAAIGIPAYHFRSELFDIYEATRHNSSREDAQPPRTERQQAAPVQTSYHARIESTPRGASVMDVTGGEAQGRPLGRTPLDVTFQNWENVLMVSKRGYYPSRIVVTRSQPEQRVTLKAIPRQGSTTGGNETEGTDDSANKGDGGSGATPEKAGRQGEQQ